MKIPNHVLRNDNTKTSKEWKQLKRRQAKAVKKAIDELRGGCAYFPSNHYDVEVAAAAIERVIEDISVKNFGG